MIIPFIYIIFLIFKLCQVRVKFSMYRKSYCIKRNLKMKSMQREQIWGKRGLMNWRINVMNFLVLLIRR